MNQNNIKPQELRLTNRVEQGEIIEIKQRTVRVRYELDGKERTSLILHEDLKPIPLSEEVLLKAGFKHKGAGFYIHASSLLDLCNIGDEFFLVGLKGVSLSKVYYLHQLQNLFYSLTGEELEVRWT